jgi:Lar family restriction alleviation protein
VGNRPADPLDAFARTAGGEIMELKPCPFCQSKNVKTFKYPSNVLDTGTDVFVQCQDCASDGPYGKDEQDAANRWNRRATDDNAAYERAAEICDTWSGYKTYQGDAQGACDDCAAAIRRLKEE